MAVVHDVEGARVRACHRQRGCRWLRGPRGLSVGLCTHRRMTKSGVWARDESGGIDGRGSGCYIAGQRVQPMAGA